MCSVALKTITLNMQPCKHTYADLVINGWGSCLLLAYATVTNIRGQPSAKHWLYKSPGHGSVLFNFFLSHKSYGPVCIWNVGRCSASFLNRTVAGRCTNDVARITQNFKRKLKSPDVNGDRLGAVQFSDRLYQMHGRAQGGFNIYLMNSPMPARAPEDALSGTVR